MVLFWFIEMNYNIIEDSIEIIWELYLVAHLEKRYRQAVPIWWTPILSLRLTWSDQYISFLDGFF